MVASENLFREFVDTDGASLKGSNAAAYDRLLRELFARPRLYGGGGRGTSPPRPPYLLTFRRVFGRYADTMLSVVFVPESWHLEEQPSGDSKVYRQDISVSVEAADGLCRVEGPVASNLLHLLTGIEDITVTEREFFAGEEGYGAGDWTSQRLLSFDDQRRLAAAELARRGSPPYDATVYEDERCWWR